MATGRNDTDKEQSRPVALLREVFFEMLVCILDMREHSGKRPVIEPFREKFLADIIQFCFEVKRILNQLLVPFDMCCGFGVRGLNHELFFSCEMHTGKCDDFFDDAVNVLTRLQVLHCIVQFAEHADEFMVLYGDFLLCKHFPFSSSADFRTDSFAHEAMSTESHRYMSANISNDKNPATILDYFSLESVEYAS